MSICKIPFCITGHAPLGLNQFVGHMCERLPVDSLISLGSFRDTPSREVSDIAPSHHMTRMWVLVALC